MVRSGKASGVGVALLLALLFALVGCGDARAPAPGKASAVAGPAERAAALPLHEFRVEVKDGRVTLVAHEADPRALLEEIARQAGFTLSAAGLAQGPVTLALDDAALLDAIAAVAAGTPLRASYRYERGTGRYALGQIALGDAEQSAVAAAGPGAPAARRADAAREKILAQAREEYARLREADQGTAEQKQAALDAIAQREQLEQARGERSAAALDAVRDPDPARRAEAVSDLDVDTGGPGLAAAIDLSQNDPDAAVRRAAVEQLGLAGSYGAMTAVIASLKDPDPEVVRIAAQAIADSNDPTLVAYLKPLALDPKLPFIEPMLQSLEPWRPRVSSGSGESTTLPPAEPSPAPP